ncbi:MAG: phage baseplate assembly protein V [Clostridiales Family XIII bacterium]|jgi:phage baseplate assembly protein gpV|nr:phage baseplate assembly protein V [Clostridiales Family XIII bacterium]
MLRANIGIKDIVVTPKVFDVILELELRREADRHTVLSVEGYVTEETADKIPTKWGDGQTLSLSFPSEEEGESKTRFVGIVTEYVLEKKGHLNLLRAKAVGMSHLTDIRPRRRSFQSETMTFEELARHLLSSCEDADFLDLVSENKPFGDFLIQYSETDWEFLRRVYSRLHARLIPDDAFGGPRIRMGPSDRIVARFEAENRAVRRRMLDFGKRSENGLPELIGQGSAELLIRGGEWLDLGACCVVNGLKLYVFGATSRMDRGLLTHEYVLCDKNGYIAPRYDNPRIRGLSLFGRVADVRKDKVRVSLDVDEGNEVCGSRWFPYSTVYSTPGGSGWYCMPEVGDAVTLYMPDGDENGAYVRSSAHVESPSRTNPDTKELSTRFGKRLRFTPGGIELSAGKNLHVRLMNDGGVTMNSPKRISVRAGGNIDITSGDQINISGEKGVNLKQADASLSVTDDVLMTGEKILIQK